LGLALPFIGASIGDSVGDIWIYNNIDLGSTCYGTGGSKMRVLSMEKLKTIERSEHPYSKYTAGNKKDFSNSYTTAVALIPTIELGYFSEIKNNLSFNNQNPGKNGTGFEYWNLANPPDTASNFYYQNYNDAGLKDTINCYLLPESPVIDQGVTIAHIRNDIEGIPRPRGNRYDIGARESSFTGNNKTSIQEHREIKKKCVALYFLFSR